METNELKLIIQSLSRQLRPKLERKYGNKWKKQFKWLIKDIPLTGPKGLRQRACKNDLELFGRIYISHFFEKPSPVFHAEINQMWSDRVQNRKDGTKTALAAPRGHAKSTNVTLKNSLHSILYQYKKYIIIISDASDQADAFLVDIKDALENNPKIKQDFGSLKGNVWNSNDIVTSTGIKVETLGSGKKIRGRKHHQYRPDLVILDDIENDKNVRTPEQRKKLMNWYYKAVSKAGAEYTDFFYIGTILHYDSLLSKVLKNPAYFSKVYRAVISFAKNEHLWDEWQSLFTDLSNDNREMDALKYFKEHEAEMLEGTEVLWPEKKSYYSLMIDLVSEGRAAFNSEFQNNPIDPEDCYFSEERIDYYNEYEVFKDIKNTQQYQFFGFVDPSLGKTRKSDFSAIITLAVHMQSRFMYIIDADIDRRLPDKIIKDINGKAKWIEREFGIKYFLFGCETNQFQWLFKNDLSVASAKEQIYLPIVEINQTSDKMGRIQSLQPFVENKYLKFNPRHRKLIEQLIYFPMADYDDGPDGLQGCVELATSNRTTSSKIRW